MYCYAVSSAKPIVRSDSTIGALLTRIFGEDVW
jgi:hypothetical protein